MNRFMMLLFSVVAFLGFSLTTYACQPMPVSSSHKVEHYQRRVEAPNYHRHDSRAMKFGPRVATYDTRLSRLPAWVVDDSTQHGHD